jgi:hypothetical protein
MVETTIQKGAKYSDAKNDSVVYVLKNGMASGKDIAVATDRATGVVKTIMTGDNVVRTRFRPSP